MDLQQCASKLRLQTCCLCHSLRTGCLILLWFWLIVSSLVLILSPFSSFDYPIAIIGIIAAIQGMGLYAIYKEKPMFLWPKILEVIFVGILTIYHDYTMNYSVIGTIFSIAFELYFAVLYYSLYRQMVENPTSLPV